MYTKTCEICGKSFEAKYKQTKLCHNPHEKECLNCSKIFYVSSDNFRKQFCCLSCSGEYRRKTGLGKEIAEKAQRTIDRNHRDETGTLVFDYGVKKCVICGKEFKPKSSRQVRCEDIHYGKCPICGKQVIIKNNQGIARTCSEECRIEASRRAIKEKYGVDCVFTLDSVKEKCKKTSLERYGVTSFTKTEEYIRKTKETSLKRYGTEYANQSEEVKQKIRETNLKKFGYEYHTQRPEWKDELNKSSMEKYGCPWPSQSEQAKKKRLETNLKKYGTPYAIHSNLSIENKSSCISNNNILFARELQNIGLDVEYEYCIGNHHFDLHIKDTNILIELNPTCNHNSYKTMRCHEGLPIDYHKNISKLALDNGFRCIHVWDWDSKTKLLNLLKPTNIISSDNIEIKYVDPFICSNFELEYGINVSNLINDVCIGLYFESILLCTMSFSKFNNSDKDYILNQFCRLPNLRFEKDFSTLLDYLISSTNPNSILYCCDFSKFTGSSFLDYGFILDKETDPIRHWYCQDRFEKEYHIVDKNKQDNTYDTNLIDRRYLPVYDCGTRIFTWNK